MSLACQRRPGREVAVLHERPVRLAAHDARGRAGSLKRRRPSGSQPSPAGSPSKSTSTRRSPSRRDREHGVVEEVRVPQPPLVPARALPEEQPGQERLGGQGLARHGAPPCPGRAIGPQYSTAGLSGASCRPSRTYLGLVTYWVLKAVLTPIFFVLFRVKVEGRENIPRHGPAVLAANHQSFCDSFFIPLVVPAQGDVPRQGGVLRLVEDGVVLPGRRSDPDPADGGQRVGAGARHGAQRRPGQGAHPRAVPRGHPHPRPVRAQGPDRGDAVVARVRGAGHPGRGRRARSTCSRSTPSSCGRSRR